MGGEKGKNKISSEKVWPFASNLGIAKIGTRVLGFVKNQGNAAAMGGWLLPVVLMKRHTNE